MTEDDALLKKVEASHCTGCSSKVIVVGWKAIGDGYKPFAICFRCGQNRMITANRRNLIPEPPKPVQERLSQQEVEVTKCTTCLGYRAVVGWRMVDHEPRAFATCLYCGANRIRTVKRLGLLPKVVVK